MARNPDRPHLLRDRLLATLNLRLQSHPELAYMFKTTIGSIRTANQMNRAMGYIEPVGQPMNRAAGPVRWRITPDGQERLATVGLLHEEAS